jgi:hypothetical protein
VAEIVSDGRIIAFRAYNAAGYRAQVRADLAAGVACVAGPGGAGGYAALLRDAGCEPLAMHPRDRRLVRLAIETRARKPRLRADHRPACES